MLGCQTIADEIICARLIQIYYYNVVYQWFLIYFLVKITRTVHEEHNYNYCADSEKNSNQFDLN